ncbi:MAG: glycine zipper 2TM domain-containing protein [Pseudomonadota bacterium]
MKMSQKILAGLMAAVPLFSLTVISAPASAQQYATTNTATPRIRGFEVDEVRRLVPGAELSFTLYGTPGGRASLNIRGAARNLALSEIEPGQYQGTYTIGSRDRITATSAVTANLRIANLVVSGVLSESLLRAPGSRGRGRDRGYDNAAGLPRIERFDVVGNDQLTAGQELEFSVYGTPGAKVDMAIEGARGVFFLPEVKPGQYTGEYIIRRSDRLSSSSVVTANMRIGDRVVTSRLNKPLLVAGTRGIAPRVVRYCTNCATVDAINVVQVDGDGNYLGAIGGGVVGAALGSQVGSGSGRTAAQIAGALGGAYVGRNIQRNAKRTQHYEVVIRFANGGTQNVMYENDPGLRVGEKVKVNNGVLERDQ